MRNANGLLGIDVGGTKVAMRVESADAAPCESTFHWSARASAEADLAEFAKQADALVAAWGGPVSAVGVALPATMADGRVTTWPGRPSWEGVEFAAVLRELFPAARIECADDGDIAALAEAEHAGCADLLYFGVGTGVGGGVVLDGQGCPGPARGSCEIGHLIIDRNGPRCDCGRNGCLQAIAAGPVTLRRAERLHGAPVTFAELRESWLAGQPWAVTAVRESAAAVAVAVAGLTEIFHPSSAVIGGGFADGLPGFASTVAEQLAGLARPGTPPVPVREAALGGRSSLHGAVLLARQAR